MSVDVSKYGGVIIYEFTPETAMQYIIETDKCNAMAGVYLVL